MALYDSSLNISPYPKTYLTEMPRVCMQFATTIKSRYCNNSSPWKVYYAPDSYVTRSVVRAFGNDTGNTTR